MSSTISNTLFIKNREKLAKLLRDNSIAIVHSQDQMLRNGDQTFPYRQNSDFFYLTGIKQEQSVLLLRRGNNENEVEEHLFILLSNPELETWEGAKLTKEQAQEISGVKSVFFITEWKEKVSKYGLEAQRIYVNLFEHPRFKPDLKLRDERMFDELRDILPLQRYERLSPLVHSIRTRKEPEEIEQIKKACTITKKGFERVLEVMNPGINESQIVAELTYGFMLNGSFEHAFHPIVASGKNACTLHYNQNSAICNDGDLVLLDFGAEWNYYASDCSRVIPVNGKFTQRQKDLYQATYEVFSHARSLMKPGTTINEVHKSVCEKWKELHISLRLYTKEELQKSEKSGAPLWEKYYMHGTSHFMGIDVHDVGSKDTTLEPGMVLTCEPGIYVNGEGIGIRLENDILITQDGNIDLMEDIPLKIKDVEK